ncbi:hypothetical protein RE428_15750 [Marinobacter nanhaiticus D15-8W]|uniref:Uncharacterized protein n=1 Tax=Marinobacter nanhaiticus D15-8W TaxID=626887 RepID=N6WNU7_9GAMM|nr:hypothetical protein [Marinobacter nanhaiticus]ENO13196.1 hypothetical protein J057_17410 [Marinobacter nanhaiticus D15-8W]BES70557.1 hypothetical protein RE428_15750 [Marinobacter nanhaiticus D15-8W]
MADTEHKPHPVPIVSRAKLEQMHTGSLMNRRSALLKCAETAAIPGDAALNRPGARARTIRFKDQPEWKQAYAELKDVLSIREHVPNKQERKAMRQERARQRK